MKTRPWPLVFLAGFQLLAPFFNVLWCAYLMKISPKAYVTALNHSSTALQLVEFYALGPISGFAIYKCRSWSYPVFISVTFWTVFENFRSWQQFPEIIDLPVLMGAYAVNILLVGYFLIPAVRMTYFNPKLRWWESQPRYEIHVDGQVGAGGESRSCHVANLSEGGVFIESDNPFPTGQLVNIDFKFLEIPFHMQGRVVYRKPDGRGCGIQFATTREMKRKLRRFIKGLHVLGIERTLRHAPWTTELAHWAKGLFTSGKGLVPELSRGPAPKLALVAPSASEEAKKRTA